jgi:CheY-like chemotaxis protein
MTMPDRDSKPANIKTILVLDDDVLVRMPIVQFLRDCGYHVVEAAAGMSAAGGTGHASAREGFGF